MKKQLIISASLLSLLASMSIMAHERDNCKERRGHRGPPKIAFEACSSAQQGESCSFTGRKGETVNGTCETKREEKLVCFPEGGPPMKGARK